MLEAVRAAWWESIEGSERGQASADRGCYYVVIALVDIGKCSALRLPLNAAAFANNLNSAKSQLFRGNSCQPALWDGQQLTGQRT
jgi:hypothetical protein